MSSKSRDLLKLGGIVVLAFAAGLAFASGVNLPRPGRAEGVRNLHYIAASGGSARTADGVLPSFADIAERVRPSVVYITTQQKVQAMQHPDLPPGFQDFFGPQFNPRRPQVRQGSGSGFVVSQDGYILTNNHVVQDADHVKVTLLDNREFDARVVGRDPATDVAVIKIAATHLSPLPLGNSDASRIGDWVLAIGNPLNFTFTVTAGIVSAKGRPLYGLQDGDRYQIQDFIQTDAAINPGNSGGPLVNLDGQVIGINAAIASQTGYYEGYGFAVPINLARKVMDDLIATGRVQRAILGVAIGQITPEDAQAVGLKDVRGVVIEDYTDASSPAKAAGLAPGDVIVALNDTAIDHVAQLQSMVGFRHPGEIVHVQAVHAGGQVRTYDVRLAEAGSDTTVVASAGGGGKAASPADETSRKLGITVQALSTDDAVHSGLTSEQRGPVVTDVDVDGPSYQKVFPPQARGGTDIILSVNGVRTRSTDELQRAVRGLKSGDIATLSVANVAGTNAIRRIVRVRVR